MKVAIANQIRPSVRQTHARHLQNIFLPQSINELFAKGSFNENLKKIEIQFLN